jgi:catechol-2,3-dioxygenase
MPPVLERVDHIHVFVADRKAGEHWYAEVLGLRRVPELAFWAVDGGPLTLTNEAGTIHLALFEKPAQPCRATIALAVDAQGFMAWLRHLSSVFDRALQAVDHQVAWSMYFADPDGNPYEIICHEHEAIAARIHE